MKTANFGAEPFKNLKDMDLDFSLGMKWFMGLTWLVNFCKRYANITMHNVEIYTVPKLGVNELSQ